MKCGSKTFKRILATAIISLPVFSACGGKGGQPPILGAVTIELIATSSISPPTITPGGTVSISAVVYDPSNGGVTWSFLPLTFGSLSNATASAVTFNAPPSFSTPTTVTITATSVTNPNVTASLQIPASPIKVLLVSPSAPPYDLEIPLADRTIAPGATATVQAAIAYDSKSKGVSWSLSPPGAGSVSEVFNGPLFYIVNYTAPASVEAPTVATLTATSVTDPSINSFIRFTILSSGAGPNVTAINVNGGPIPGQVYVNGAFIDGVTICNPGSIQAGNTLTFPVCQTVDGILVDTGSSGLRILQSQIPLLSLPTFTNVGPNGTNTLEDCYSFADGSFLWGPVSKADVYIGGEMVSTYVNAMHPAVIQVIDSAASVVPDGCANGGVNLNTPQLLGANGILGIGPEPTDCTLFGANYCDGSVQAEPPNIYYACPKSGCELTDSPVLASEAQFQQVANLASSLGYPGTIVDLPPVTGSQPSLSGTLTFATSLAGATTYTLGAHDTFTTTLGGQILPSSFIDSGSNALYFPGALATCNVSTNFFCPETLMPFSAENQGKTQGQGMVNFSVGNADRLFATYPGFAEIETLAGPNGSGVCSGGQGACVFEWGLPFFYGRPVFTRIDSCAPPPALCSDAQRPAWAY